MVDIFHNCKLSFLSGPFLKRKKRSRNLVEEKQYSLNLQTFNVWNVLMSEYNFFLIHGENLFEKDYPKVEENEDIETFEKKLKIMSRVYTKKNSE